jgi:hypothetical protein
MADNCQSQLYYCGYNLLKHGKQTQFRVQLTGFLTLLQETTSTRSWRLLMTTM